MATALEDLGDLVLHGVISRLGNELNCLMHTRIWRESFAMYPRSLVKRVKQCWIVIKTWLAENFLEAAVTLLDGASEAELNELEVELGLKLPPTTRLLISILCWTATSKPHFKKTHHSGTLGVIDALVIPAQSMNDSQQQGGMLLWLAEHGRRLQNGIIKVCSKGGNRSISLFPEVELLCSTAVTHCIQVRASAMFVPEISDLRNDEDKYYYAYSIRMCLLPQVYSLDGFHFDCCQISSRHWIIRAKDTVVDDVSGEGVIGLYPVLHPDGKEFVYESCTPLPCSPGSIEGSFTFVPGRLSSPKGSPFDVQVARVPLELPEYIF